MFQPFPKILNVPIHYFSNYQSRKIKQKYFTRTRRKPSVGHLDWLTVGPLNCEVSNFSSRFQQTVPNENSFLSRIAFGGNAFDDDDAVAQLCDVRRVRFEPFNNVLKKKFVWGFLNANVWGISESLHLMYYW